MPRYEESVSITDKLEPFQYAQPLGLFTEELNSLGDMLSSGIFSGFFCFYGIEKTAPLYYLDDKLLLHLGYDREELDKQIKEDISAILYTEDAKALKKSIDTIIETQRNDSIIFRIHGKCGNSLLLSSHMKYIKLPDGINLVAGILIDITTKTNNKPENQIMSPDKKQMCGNAPAKNDVKSGIYDRDQTFQSAKQYLTKECPEGLHAFFKVELTDFERISSSLGPEIKDCIMNDVIKSIKLLFRETDIIGQIDDYKFLIVLKNVGAVYTLRRKAEELVDTLLDCYETRGIRDEVWPTVGIALYQGGGHTFETVYDQVTLAVDKAKGAGKKHYFLITENSNMNLPSVVGNSEDHIHFEALLRYLDGGVVLVELADQPDLIYASPSYEEALGRNKRKFGENGEALFQKIHPSDREGLGVSMRAGAANWEPVNTRFRAFSENGEIVWRHIRAVRIPYETRRNPVMMAVISDITGQKQQEIAELENAERVRIAFEQTSRTLWEVDIAKKTVAIFDITSNFNTPAILINNCPQGMIEAGWVHPNSTDIYTEFFNSILAGKYRDKGAFIMRYTNMKYGWASLSYHMLYDDDGNPRKAIGILEELPTISNERDRFLEEEQMIESLRLNLLVGVKVNLTTDVVEAIWSNETDDFFQKDIETYTELTAATQELLFLNEDITLYGLRFSLNSLAEAYSNGNNWVSMEYRRKDADGNILWTANTVSLLTDPITRQLYGFIYIRDVDQRRSLEAALPVTVERDLATHLYSTQTMERLIHALIQQKTGKDKLYSMALIQVSGFHLIKVEKGEESVGRERSCIGRMLRIYLDNDCFVGQIKDDELLVFCPNAPSEEWMRQRMENVLLQIQNTRKSLNLTAPLVFVAGVATERAHSATYKDMLARASYVCEKHKNATADAAVSFSFYSENLRITDVDMEDRAYTSAEDGESKRPLTAEEKNVMYDCMQSMLSADKYDASLNDILSHIGRYYNADKVYTLLLVSDNTAVSVQHEWIAPGKHSLMWSVTGMPLDKVFILKRSLSAAKPVLLGTTKTKSNLMGDDLSLEQEWRYITVPFMEKDSIFGFLCVENPKEHYSDTALLNAVMPLMLHERARYGLNSRGMEIAGRDGLTGLKDRNTYTELIRTFNPDAFSTLGILYTAVVDLEKLNRERGEEAGNRMLVTASRILAEAFQKENVYRISEYEFVSFCHNRTKETFTGSCIVVQSKLQRQFPKQFAFGETWANKNFTARQMVTNAERLMRYGNPQMRQAESRVQTQYGNISAHQLKRELEQGYYVVHLQPKVDMRNNKLVGAEALIRYKGDSGKTISPSEFIPMLEAAHLIRELDFYVMDKTLAAMQHWKDNGIEMLPLSVNFSRQTLLDTSALASALAIQSRYDIPAAMIEIEVTESLGDFETSTIFDAISSFREHGFRFSLDDFGSQYSNLGMLGEIPFDTIKLDKSYTTNFAYNEVSRAILESIINVCEKNGMTCVAEGIETEAQAQVLMGVGCYIGQGYYYGKPMTIEDFGQKYMVLEEEPGEGGNMND